LRKVRTFASRILENESGALTEKGKDYFARIQSAIARMQTLIEDLLAYSHTNKAERKPEMVDLNQILEEVKTDLKDSIEEKGATIESTHLCGADINPSQFRQLLHNLIGNALKFSDPGRKTVITIKSHTDRGSKLQSALPASAGGKSSLQAPEFIPDRKYCHIEFSDNGIGFEPRYGEKIFGVFQRLHGKEQYAGTGIGLSIVKKIVENHGGFITATGELNKGARFDIYIPTF
jgi:signal transduction histidine kinase